MILLIAAGVYYFSSIRNFMAGTARILLNREEQKDSIVSQQVANPGVSNVQIPENSALTNITKSDTIHIKTDLEYEYFRLCRLSDELKGCQKDNNQQPSGIFDTNYMEIDKLLHDLDSLQGIVASVADISGNRIISLKNPAKALRILDPLKNSVSRLKILAEKHLKPIV